MNPIRVVVCRVGQRPVITAIDPEYEALRMIVGGPIEFAYVDHGVELVCNEEGTITGLPFNRDVPAVAPPLPDWLRDAEVIGGDDELVPPGSGRIGVHRIHGDFMICGEGLTSLSTSLAEVIASVLDVP